MLLMPAFTHGLISRWTYLSRTIPGIGDLFKPLEATIRQKFLPSLTGQSPFSNTHRDLMAIPVRLGGLGIIDPSIWTTAHYCASQVITQPLTELIYKQSHSYTPEVRASQSKIKNSARILRRQYESLIATELKAKLPNDLQRAVTASTERGASSWLSTLPIGEHGFALHKGAFRDALCLRYGWRPPHLPSYCVCDKKFTIDHALSC